MLGHGKQRVRQNAASAYALALRLASDREFRERVVSAIDHGLVAGRRARRGRGLTGAVVRLAADESLLGELRSLRADLEQAYERVEAKRRTHRLRNVLFLVGLASLVGLPRVRTLLGAAIAKTRQWRAGAGNPTAPSPSPDSRESPHRLEDLSKEELYERAKEVGLPGRSEMSKEQLVEALRAKS